MLPRLVQSKRGPAAPPGSPRDIVRKSFTSRRPVWAAPRRRLVPGSGAGPGRRADGGHDLLGQDAGLAFAVARGPEHERVHLGLGVQGGESLGPAPDGSVKRVYVRGLVVGAVVAERLSGPGGPDDVDGLAERRPRLPGRAAGPSHPGDLLGDGTGAEAELEAAAAEDVDHGRLLGAQPRRPHPPVGHVW